MATISEIREKLRAGEIVVLCRSSLSLFMQECQTHPAGTEHYVIKPHSPGHSAVYDPLRVKEAV